MSKQIDAYSFALGVCEAFCEVVRAGVKRIALSQVCAAGSESGARHKTGLFIERTGDEAY